MADDLVSVRRLLHAAPLYFSRQECNARPLTRKGGIHRYQAYIMAYHRLCSREPAPRSAKKRTGGVLRERPATAPRPPRYRRVTTPLWPRRYPATASPPKPPLLPATKKETLFSPAIFRPEEEPSSEFALRRNAKRFTLGPTLGGSPSPTARSPAPTVTASGEGKDPLTPPLLTPVLLPTSTAGNERELSDNGSSRVAREFLPLFIQLLPLTLFSRRSVLPRSRPPPPLPPMPPPPPPPPLLIVDPRATTGEGVRRLRCCRLGRAT